LKPLTPAPDDVLTIAPAPRPEHELDLVLDGHERAPEVDGDQAVPLVVGDLVRGLDRLLDPGVVEGDVQAAEALDRRGQRVLDLLAARHITRDSERLSSRLLDQAGGRAGTVRGHVGDHDARALAG
jgi:hypothetical protein